MRSVEGVSQTHADALNTIVGKVAWCIQLHFRELGMCIEIRDLRDRLNQHLVSVRDGHTITVTDHGKPVARIVPVGTPTSLERLIAEGRVTPAPQHGEPRPAPVSTAGIVSDLVGEQRR